MFSSIFLFFFSLIVTNKANYFLNAAYNAKYLTLQPTVARGRMRYVRCATIEMELACYATVKCRKVTSNHWRRPDFVPTSALPRFRCSLKEILERIRAVAQYFLQLRKFSRAVCCASLIWSCMFQNSWRHGRRKSGQGGALAPLDFEIFSKKVFFLGFEREKLNFITFGPP